ncbi:MAG: PDZ domain-containing protein [Desulfatitalea sp.]|nr:PDZ domain-containing protein [Desulfatitalea sp.]
MWFVNTMTIQRITALVNLALITIGAYWAVAIFYKVVTLQVQSPPPQMAAMPGGVGAQAPVAPPLSHYNPILERDLFKTSKAPSAEGPSQAVNVDALEETQLQLKLWGTVSGDTPNTYAVIEDTQKREQSLFRVGDTVQNATVKMILREKVVLSVDNRDEVLAMEEPGTTGATAPMAAGRGQPAVMASAAPAMDQRITLQRAMIEDAFQDVNRLMTEVAITPYMQDGRAEGLAFNNIRPNSIFRRMGLRNGDVLRGVNGEQIQSMDDAMRLYNNLRTSDEVQLQIMRRGQERNILYNLR